MAQIFDLIPQFRQPIVLTTHIFSSNQTKRSS